MPPPPPPPRPPYPGDAALRRAARPLLWRAAAGAAAAAAAGAALCGAALPLLLAAPLVYAAAELAFLLVYAQKYQVLSGGPGGAGQRPLDYCPSEFFEKATEHLKQARPRRGFEDVRSFLSLWFRGAPFSELRRGNVSELLAYAFFYRTVAAVEQDGQGAELEGMVDRLMGIWSIELKPGYNPNLRFMGHLWEPLSHMWRPLGFYVWMEAAAAARHAALAAMGFRRRRAAGLTYYVRPGAAAAAAAGGGGGGAGAGLENSGDGGGGEGSGDGGAAVPMLLLHGVGMGLLPYLAFIAHLAATGRPVIAVEFKHISMRWCNWLPSVDEAAQAVECVLAREDAPAACVVAHSYGTAVASRLLQARPRRVAHLCMVDPVCFHMFMPNLLRNFLYRPPGTGSALADFAMASAARELHVSASLSRRFFWTDVILWEDQLPPGSLVVLSGRDALMATREVHRWLEWHTQVEVMVHPRLAHAEFLVRPAWQRAIVARLLPLQDAALEARAAAARGEAGAARGEGAAALSQAADEGSGGGGGGGTDAAAARGGQDGARENLRRGEEQRAPSWPVTGVEHRGGRDPDSRGAVRRQWSEGCLACRRGGGADGAANGAAGREAPHAGTASPGLGSRRGSVQPLFPVWGVLPSDAVLHGLPGAGGAPPAALASAPPFAAGAALPVDINGGRAAARRRAGGLRSSLSAGDLCEGGGAATAGGRLQLS
ncbi:MAG: Alpha/Beta hydrolase protein [Monoraphidium minutum]|nr:MAG: Alpha/Beta hydrolase protein [Monoraphidium minutum]